MLCWIQNFIVGGGGACNLFWPKWENWTETEGMSFASPKFANDMSLIFSPGGTKRIRTFAKVSDWDFTTVYKENICVQIILYIYIRESWPSLGIDLLENPNVSQLSFKNRIIQYYFESNVLVVYVDLCFPRKCQIRLIFLYGS